MTCHTLQFVCNTNWFALVGDTNTADVCVCCLHGVRLHGMARAQWQKQIVAQPLHIIYKSTYNGYPFFSPCSVSVAG